MRKLLTQIFLYLFLLTMILSQVSVNHVSAQNSDLPVYVVQSGDTLYSIALQFNSTIDEITAANTMIDPNFLAIGDQIKIPGLDGITGILTIQTIPFGASLKSISRQNLLDETTFLKLNRLTSPAEVFAGTELVIPIQTDTPNLSPIINTGSELSAIEIAAINKTSPWTIRNINSLQSSWRILPNEMIYLPIEVEVNENSLALPFIDHLEIDSLPLIQGATVEIKIETSNSITPYAELLGRHIHFFTEQENELIAIFGVSAVAEPGVYPLIFEFDDQNGKPYRFEQWVLLKEAGFVNDPEIYVTPESVDPDVIAAEDALLESYILKYTPTRYWDDMFWPPVDDRTCVVGYYGNRRSYNDGALLYYHTGIDYGYCTGIEVFAPAKGVVVAVEPDLTVRGNALIIDHGWGVFTGYWHLDEFLVGVGDVVFPGQLIAYMGNTGRSAGPHLHFEMIVNGIAVNPETWLINEFP